jgi:lysozyme
MTRRIGPKGRALIQQFEDCARKLPDGRFAAYPDPATGSDPWTIGWGSTGPDIHKGASIPLAYVI